VVFLLRGIRVLSVLHVGITKNGILASRINVPIKQAEAMLTSCTVKLNVQMDMELQSHVLDMNPDKSKNK
jgi:hypothetical protein